MFGYIRFSKGELKVNEYETYRAVYCSLCKYLGKHYGILSRFTLSYDFTFLTVLNIGMGGGCPECKKGRCVFNPLKKCNYCTETEKFSMPAAAATITFYYKVIDNIEDEKGIKRLLFRFLKLLFARKHKKAANMFPSVEKTVAEYINKQRETEQKSDGSLDISADPTATALGKILELCSEDGMQKRALNRLGYCLGRYIYLLDAACDIEKDIKSGNYNPLKKECGNKLEAKERVMPQLYASVNEAAKAFELLDFKCFKTLIANVVYLGLEETFKKELENEKPV